MLSLAWALCELKKDMAILILDSIAKGCLLDTDSKLKIEEDTSPEITRWRGLQYWTFHTMLCSLILFLSRFVCRPYAFLLLSVFDEVCIPQCHPVPL